MFKKIFQTLLGDSAAYASDAPDQKKTSKGPVVITIPYRDDGIEHVILQKWHVNVGNAIRPREIICEATSKSTRLNVESSYRGTVLYTAGPPGTQIAVNSILAIIGDPDDDFEALLA